MNVFKKIAITSFFIASFLTLSQRSVFADVSIETSVSKSRVELGGQVTLDIIISDAKGKISKPVIGSMDGFTAYSQGHSQEIQIVNGQMSSRSVYSYVLMANSPGKKKIGPFEIGIEGKTFKAAPVEIEVVQGGSGNTSGSLTGNFPNYSQTPASSPNPRALPQTELVNEDIFVKVWLDKDEVYINEPVMMTYTLYTRLSATYKGFDKEPTTTGFWVEDFPPEKTIKRTEQMFNGQRYVVADVRKIELFPTKAGTLTVDPGVLSAAVELRDDGFDNFYSSNVFGRRSQIMGSPFAQIIQKSLTTEAIRIKVKALPTEGKPIDFQGAVGDYKIESSIDKYETEVGDPVTYRLKISGEGNLGTLELPTLPKMEDFKTYDSSTSSNISKDRLIVEGEKTTETIIVPKKAGSLKIPAITFSYFDVKTNSYKTVKTDSFALKVSASTQPDTKEDSYIGSSGSNSSGVIPANKEEIAVTGNDIRYIKSSNVLATKPWDDLSAKPWIWHVTGLAILLAVVFSALSALRKKQTSDIRGIRFRRSHQVAKRNLKKASEYLKHKKSQEFYTELSRALRGYFADKLNLSSQILTPQDIEAKLPANVDPGILSQVRQIFGEISKGQYGLHEHDDEEMKEVYKMADRLITEFERVKLK